MGRKRHTAEQIIGKLRTAEIELAKGLGTAEVVRKLGIADRIHDGRGIRMLVIVDEFTRECLAIEVARSLRSQHVLECLGDLFLKRGTPD